MPAAGVDRDALSAFGQYLSTLRQSKDLTLRDVESQSDRAISNAYLSQLEKGKVKSPSPHLLHTLSEIYRISYLELMTRAGYVTADQGQRRAATYSITELSAAEQEQLLDYLKLVRKQARKRA